jgi:hypothetical protein
VPDGFQMENVALIRGVLRGMDREARCEVVARKHSAKAPRGIQKDSF